MPTCTRSFTLIIGSITCLLAGCGDSAMSSTSAFALIGAPTPSVSQALRPCSESAAVYAASQVEFNAMELARLTLHRTHSPQVKEFASQMLEGHDSNRKSLRRIASKYGFHVATAMDTFGQTMWGTLFVQSGAPFDRAFVEALEGLRERGLGSIATLEQLAKHEETAAWCEAAAECWHDEETSSSELEF